MKLTAFVAATLLCGRASFGATIDNQDPTRARRRLEICDSVDTLVLASGGEQMDRADAQFEFDVGGPNERSVRVLTTGEVLHFLTTSRTGTVLWRSGVADTNTVNRALRMQGDGNLVVVNNPSGDSDSDAAAPETILYETGTGGNPGAELRIDVDNDGLAIVNNLDGNCEIIRFFALGDCLGGCAPVAESDLGRYEIATPLVNYNPNDGNPSDTNSNPINFPSILIAMEHDDVTGVIPTNTQYGSIQLRHFKAGCTEEIQVDSGTALGEARQDPIAPADTSVSTGTEAVAPDVTGLNGDYNFVLQDGSDTLNGVLTIIRYPVDVLTNEAAGITETNTATGESTTRFCTRLELVDGLTPPVVRGFRTIDVTLRFSQDNLSDLTIDTVEDNEDEIPVPTELGDFSVSMYRAEPDDLTTPILVGDVGAIVNQGEQFTIALVPQVDQGGGVQETTEVNIVSVESCVFFLDALGNVGTQDPGDTFDEVISDNNAEDNVEGFRCEESVFGNDIVGCVFAVGLSAEFFNVPSSSPDTSLVSGQCTVMLEFQGTRRRVQVSLEEGFSLSTGVGILVENNFVEESCTDGCFFLFCWIRFIFCFIQSILAGLGSGP